MGSPRPSSKLIKKSAILCYDFLIFSQFMSKFTQTEKIITNNGWLFNQFAGGTWRSHIWLRFCLSVHTLAAKNGENFESNGTKIISNTYFDLKSDFKNFLGTGGSPLSNTELKPSGREATPMIHATSPYMQGLTAHRFVLIKCCPIKNMTENASRSHTAG